MKLKHQDYEGKRVILKISDKYKNTLDAKIDIGVHKYLELEQSMFCFDVSLNDESVSLLINSKEQMIVEKLKSFLKWGAQSTRYKDIYDIYYLLNNCNIKKINKALDILIFKDPKMKEQNNLDIKNRLKMVFNNALFLKNFETSKKNWIGIENSIVLKKIISFF